MFKTTQLFWELRNFLKEVEQYQNEKEYIGQYWFYKENGKMFDVDGLKDHLRDYPISDPRSYTDIDKMANRIVDHYNDYSENKELKLFDNKLKYDENKQKFYGTHSIVAISVIGNKFAYYPYLDVFEEAFKTYETISFYRIANICVRILNVLNHFGHSKPLQDESIKEELPNYCDLGVLVVIKEEITKDVKSGNYSFEGKIFKTSTELENYLLKNKKTTTTSIRQYLDDSFGSGKHKDLFDAKRIKKIFQYYIIQGKEIPDHIKTNYPKSIP